MDEYLDRNRKVVWLLVFFISYPSDILIFSVAHLPPPHSSDFLLCILEYIITVLVQRSSSLFLAYKPPNNIYPKIAYAFPSSAERELQDCEVYADFVVVSIMYI